MQETRVTIEGIAAKSGRGERITPEEALMLYREAPPALLARLAMARKRALSGDAIYFNRNIHIEPTNLCLHHCRFCSYRRQPDEEGSWEYSLEEIERIARSHAHKTLTEVHVTGGVHPGHDLAFYGEIVRRIKRIFPQATVKAFTATELNYVFKKAGVTADEGLRQLKAAGLESIPGGGAEIFDAEIRTHIAPDKGSAESWLAIHEAAHHQGIGSNATMLYGHVENLEHRIDHMERLRTLQDRTGGFNAFIPLKYRKAGNPLSEEDGISEVSAVEDMRTLAIARIFLDNFPHIKAYWPMYGKTVTEMALAFGADDMDGTIDDTTRIYAMAGAEEQSPSLSVGEIAAMARAAGLRAVERDTFYHEL